MFNPLWVNCQKRPNTIRLRYPVPGTVLVGTGAGAGAGFEKMAGYPANRNRNRVSGTSLDLICVILGLHFSCCLMQTDIAEMSMQSDVLWEVR